MSLRADFELVRGGFTLDVELEVRPGATLGLVGPNGAGKTSFLLAVAGLLRVVRGALRHDDVVLDGGPRGAFVPPQERSVGFVFQDHLLFPHLSALDNVGFGLRCRGVARREARRQAQGWLERVGLGDRAAARPQQLSGGQRQRVALARALAGSPRILLLDEPLAAVDASARIALRRELRAHLEAFAGVRILVAHAAVDAFSLADRIAVLESGRLVQVGTVDEICSKPNHRYVADLVGLNFFRGVARGGVVAVEGGGTLVAAASPEGPVVATLHPRSVAVFKERPEGSPRNVWQAPIVGIEPALDSVRIRLGGPLPLVAEITAAAQADLRLRLNDPIWVAIKASEVAIAPA